MKKNLLSLMGVLLVLIFSGCPTEEDTSTISLPDGPAPEPVLSTGGGFFFEGEAILMQVQDGATIYYTLDGTTPFIGSARYDSENLPIARFGVKEEITIKALSAWGTKEGTESGIVTGTYGKSIPGVDTLGALALEIAVDSRGDTVDNPVPVKVSPNITLSDIELVYYEGQENEVTDGIGGLYKAFGNKYVALDLSGVDWKVLDDDGKLANMIPGLNSSGSEYTQRPNRTRLVGVTFPKDAFMIGSQAFRDCTNLKKIDLAGMSKLTAIDSAAFQSCSGATEVDFTGCTSLKAIWNYSFSGCSSLQMFDLSSCTSFERTGDFAMTGMSQMRYIEFPPHFVKTGEYSGQGMGNLKYIRFRTPTPANDFGWSSWLYVTTSTNNDGFVTSHLNRNSGDSRVAAHMNVYAMFHPNTVAWTAPTGGYWSEDGTRDGYGAHHVPLPYSGDPDHVYPPEVDALRGEDLLNYTGYARGLDSVTVDATGLDSRYNGKTVTAYYSSTGNANANGAEGVILASPTSIAGTINNGAVTLTIPEPAASDLVDLDNTSGQIITGLYGTQSAVNIPGGESGTTDAWTSNGYASHHGRPWIWPSWQKSGSGVKFAFLQLKIDNGDGTESHLLRHGKAYYKNGWVGGGGVEYSGREYPGMGPDLLVKEIRTMGYVYVDKDTNIFRYRRATGARGGNLFAVWMPLKKGWNQIEVEQEAGTGIKVWVSGGIITDDNNGTAPPDLKVFSDPAKVNNWTNLNMPYKDIPWVIREEDTYYESISPVNGTADAAGNLIGPQWLN
ncbi:hypothetical protein AGMMS50267_12060 [Spirochaetia bacterium]|nr:hypothetical protein AGMMS50267_12060 [Spirochaetia bacterium]